MSTPRIRVLPPELADQIAAGEVVERPASVVKELVENALDAGARRVEIDIEGGGRRFIRVTDDGIGMTPEDARLALRRHATSKLATLADLFALTTMGFRGEALPSIAAVSRLTLTTRSADAPEREGAHRIEVEGGVVKQELAAGGPVGTEVVVRDLLHNVPARLKFLKADVTETGHVAEAAVRLGLAFPEVHLRLRSQGRLLVDLPLHASALERARAALGRSRGEPARLHLAAGEENGVQVEAFLAAPLEAGSTARGTYLLVNRRFVRDRGLLHAACMGYGEILERGRYPLAVVQLTLPGGGVDVNVHPQKLEVRFARPQEVYAAVRHILQHAVAQAPWLDDPPGGALKVYSFPPDAFVGSASPRDRAAPAPVAREPIAEYGPSRQQALEALQLFAPVPSAALFNEPTATATAAAPETSGRGFFGSLLYLGQLHRTYLVCQAPGEMVLVDQHAAHERVAFERLRQAHSRLKVPTQRLLLPVTLELDEELVAAAVEHAPLLAALGLELEAFGPRTVLLRAVPEVLERSSPGEVAREILADLALGEATSVIGDRSDHLLATIACHSVVRAGDVLQPGEARALLDTMDGIDYRAHCPHGRPVLLRMPLAEIERRLGRT